MKNKLWIISIVIFCIALIVQVTAIYFQSYTLELRVIEKNGVYIVQSNLRCGFISDWDDKKKFRQKENAEEYMNEWYKNYKAFKENEIED